VRTVALLLVLVGLQAGAFRDLDTGHEWYFGTGDHSAAVLPEARKADPTIGMGPIAEAPRIRQAPVIAETARDALPETGSVRAVHRLLPDPTGPPRA